MSSTEYWKQIRSIAIEAISETLGDDEDLINDTIHEMVDGHEYVIYTHKAFQVRSFTDNWDSYHDVYGDELHGNHIDELISKYAYFAMAADVNDQIRRWEDLVEEIGPDDDPSCEDIGQEHVIAALALSGIEVDRMQLLHSGRGQWRDTDGLKARTTKKGRIYTAGKTFTPKDQ